MENNALTCCWCRKSEHKSSLHAIEDEEYIPAPDPKLALSMKLSRDMSYSSQAILMEYEKFPIR